MLVSYEALRAIVCLSVVTCRVLTAAHSRPGARPALLRRMRPVLRQRQTDEPRLRSHRVRPLRVRSCRHPGRDFDQSAELIPRIRIQVGLAAAATVRVAALEPSFLANYSVRPSLTKRHDTRRVTGDWIAGTVSLLPVTGGAVPSGDGVRAQHDPDQTDRHHSQRSSDAGPSPHLMGTSLPAPGCRRGRSRSSVGAGPFEAGLERPSRLHRDNPPGARR